MLQNQLQEIINPVLHGLIYVDRNMMIAIYLKYEINLYVFTTFYISI